MIDITGDSILDKAIRERLVKKEKCIFCGDEGYNLLPTQSIDDSEKQLPCTEYVCRCCLGDRMFINGKKMF
jgi:hypothetical protein